MIPTSASRVTRRCFMSPDDSGRQPERRTLYGGRPLTSISVMDVKALCYIPASTTPSTQPCAPPGFLPALLQLQPWRWLPRPRGLSTTVRPPLPAKAGLAQARKALRPCCRAGSPSSRQPLRQLPHPANTTSMYEPQAPTTLLRPSGCSSCLAAGTTPWMLV